MPIDEVEFGKLIGLMEGLQAGQTTMLSAIKDVETHFIEHGLKDDVRFNSLETSIAYHKGQLRTWGIVVTSMIALGTGLLTYLKNR